MTSLSPHLSEIRSQLESLADRDKLAFGCWLVNGLLPGYIDFTQEVCHPDGLSKICDFIWDSVFEQKTDLLTIDHFSEEVMKMEFDTNSSRVYWEEAEQAACAIYSVLQALKSDPTKHVVSAANNALKCTFQRVLKEKIGSDCVITPDLWKVTSPKIFNDEKVIASMAAQFVALNMIKEKKDPNYKHLKAYAHRF